ncbi:MAG: hypothetical protein WCA08_05440 [Desulfoferrobacter sp.]
MEAIDALLDRAPDHETGRKILEEITAGGSCEFGGALGAWLGEVICEFHLVEFRNRVLHHTRQINSKKELSNSVQDEPGSQ